MSTLERPRGIGGSDAAAAIGLDPYRSPVRLWLEKTGREPARETGEAAEWGNRLQPILADRLADEGYEVLPAPADTITGPTPFMFAHPDAYIASDQGRGIAELKTCGHWIGPQWEDGIPVQYQAQAAHYMACADLPFVVFGCLIGGQRFVTRTMERDGELEAMLLEKEAAFWRYVETDTPPPPTFATADDLKLLYPESQQGGVCVLDDVPALVDELLAARQAARAADAEQDRCELAIKARMGDAELATLRGARVVSWASHERKGIDSTALRGDHPNIAAKYAKVSTVRPFRVLA